MEIRDERSLGERVRDERLLRGVDQRDLAAEAGVSLSALRRLESGGGSTLRTALAVMSALDLSLCIPGTEAQVERQRALRLRGRPEHLKHREERTSWQIHRAVAEKLRRSPSSREAILGLARTNLDRAREIVRGPQAHAWLDQWQEALDGPVRALIDLMLREDAEGIDLRQVSPFAGALTQEERLQAIRRAVAA